MSTQSSGLAGTSPRKRILAPTPVKIVKTTKRLYPAGDLGLPSREECEEVINEYLQSLSIRKREKALITQEMFDDIWDVLQEPTARIRTPQFRFWVRKMFKLSHSPGGSRDAPYVPDDSDMVPVILHEGRPVAVKEQIHDILCFYHLASGHGGRDKTMAEVRDNYSWVPKELVSRFVKACPTCSSRRPGYPSRMSTLESLAARKLSLNENHMVRISSSDGGSDVFSSSASQAVSLASSEEGFVTNPASDPGFAPVPAFTLASLLESRILPPPVVSPILRSPPLGSPNLSADPRKWLADLAMQPGPNCVGTSHRFSPLDLRRVGSENDADPMHGRVPLPPLMKALSDGMADGDLYRPAFNVPPGFQIPRRDLLSDPYSADIALSGSTGGLQYPLSDGSDNANIDPTLLYSQSVATTYEDYYRSQQSTNYIAYTQPVQLQQTTLASMNFDFALVQRSVSEESISSEGSAQSLGSVMSCGESGGEGEQLTKGMQQSSSFDPQDWESSYCLDDI